jgi:indolepyruvate ferredoxin oxidoreductase alpha subunit
MFGKRTVTMMGDGGFWHNGLTTGIANAVFNKNDGVLVIMKNGYSSATGTQELPSSPQHSESKAPDMSMERALEGIGVGWVKTVDNYRVGAVAKTLKEAMTADYQGLKVIIAEGECQLERQRKLRPLVSKQLSEGKRTVRVKYGVDEDTCTGDHSCIRLSGCPTLTIKDNPDPLRTDPVATVIDGCVGCGLCGENAHAAVLCPSFYRAEVIQNPTWWDKLVNRFRGTAIH